MKKILYTAILILSLGATGLYASQYAGTGMWCRGPEACDGPENCQKGGPDTKAMEAFWEETGQLRARMFELRKEYFTIMNDETPDKEYAEQVWSEMFDVQNQLREKAEAAGVEMGRRGGCGNCGTKGEKMPCGKQGRFCPNADTIDNK